MDELSAQTLADYRKGQFAHAAAPAIMLSALPKGE
jgi:hypothetical protein